MKPWLQLAALAILIIFAVSLYIAWREVRRQQEDLKERLAATQQQVQAADAHEESRKAQLQQQLAELTRQQKTIQTPQQALEAMPAVLPLPKPLVFDSVMVDSASCSARSLDRSCKSASPASQAATSPTTAQGASESVPQPKASIPPEDLKPLYDYALACKACQAQLAAAQADLKDEKAKTQALGRERDDALRAARGGSALQRVARAAKWFVIGTAAGALAAKAAH
jgi:ABC-type nickel/cobalt efflux system permease component RcnA